ncbi:GPI-anchored surface protein, putative [Bodo saltans]|uniref:GPI-anchored surface protein, putative n=1 Tax=Bodo saltans TaxID=75058 RepID=A0A0S4JI14_BODSA|nr:GPI-anchored surface protein, putative [Bodo saltans]|eukprot:CUG89784.1 GPI-anchored surface protein, putative [Bodo saltans]
MLFCRLLDALRSQEVIHMFRHTFLSVLIIMMLAAPMEVFGRGCGQPSNDILAACTDWQCSRTLAVQSSANATTSYYCLRGLASGEGPCHTNADCYNELSCNTTSSLCVPTGTTKNAAIGYVGVAIAVLLFGTNYIPARRLRSGNGVFFQFAMAMGILVVGVVIQLVRGSSTIYPAAMLGGMFWAIGNCASVRAINAIGMGLAVTTWGCSNMLVGWAGGRFGAWGMSKEIPTSEVYSILGVAFGLVAIVVFGFVKPAEDRAKEEEEGKYASLVDDDEDSSAPTTAKKKSILGVAFGLVAIVVFGFVKPAEDRANDEDEGKYASLVDDEDSSAPTTAAAEPLSPSKRIAGFMIALACGVCYGFNFFPSQAMMDHYGQRTQEGNTQYSPNGLDYSFSMFLGIFPWYLSYVDFVLADGAPPS